jgi:hypothetical protein
MSLADNDLLVETIPELSYEELLLTLTHKQEQRIAQLVSTQDILLAQIAQLSKDLLVYLAKPAVKGANFAKQSQEIKEQQTAFVDSLEAGTATVAAIERVQQELVIERKQRVLAEYKRAEPAEKADTIPTPAVLEFLKDMIVVPTAEPFDPTAELEQDEDPSSVTAQAAQLLNQLNVKFIT